MLGKALNLNDKRLRHTKDMLIVRIMHINKIFKVQKTPTVNFLQPGDSQGITKYLSDQYVNCWKQWRTDDSDHVSVSRRLINGFSGGFWVLISLSGTDLEHLIEIYIFNSLNFK